MARSIAQRLAALEKTVAEFIGMRPARKKAKRTAKRPKKAKTRSTRAKPKTGGKRRATRRRAAPLPLMPG
jgi:hypothetical protein